MKRVAILLLAAALAAAGCRKDNVPSTPASSQPASASAPAGAARIISFSPALTAILFEMGLGDRVVGVTAYCTLPAGQKRTVVGDRQNINAERILSVKGDAILIQQDPKDFDLVRRIDPKIRIEHFTIEKLSAIGEAVERIGRLAGQAELGMAKRKAFEDRLEGVRKQVQGLERPKVLLLTGLEPPSVAGRDSFLHEMIELAGGTDVTARYERWTQINVERMLLSNPDVVICQSPAGQADQARAFLLSLKDMPAARDGRVFIVSDMRWTIPSMHLAELAGELAAMIHPPLTGKGGSP